MVIQPVTGKSYESALRCKDKFGLRHLARQNQTADYHHYTLPVEFYFIIRQMQYFGGPA
jgi:hypothetical protein